MFVISFNFKLSVTNILISFSFLDYETSIKNYVININLRMHRMGYERLYIM